MRETLVIILAVFALLMLGTLSMAVDLGLGDASPNAAAETEANATVLPTPSLSTYPHAGPAFLLSPLPTPEGAAYPSPLPAPAAPMPEALGQPPGGVGHR
mgnify:CR=1 FL=1